MQLTKQFFQKKKTVTVSTKSDIFLKDFFGKFEEISK